MRYAIFLIATCLFCLSAQAGAPEAAALSRQSGGIAMLVIEKGEIVFEDYTAASGLGKAVQLASGTKSFSAVIAAAAVQDGLLTLDEKAADTLVEWRGHPQKERITIRQILSLTSGFETTRIGDIPAYAKAIESPIKNTPGSAFEYGSVNFQIFGEIMRRKLTKFENGAFKDPVEYLQARIFNPLGINPPQWRSGANTYPMMSAGAYMNARDWATFGHFVLQGGAWNGVQLVDAETLDASRKGSSINAAYGLAWWLNKKPSQSVLSKSRTMRQTTDLYTNPDRSKLPDDLFLAAGAGDQRLYIIPSRNMVIVRQTAGVDRNRRSGRSRGNLSARERRQAYRNRSRGRRAQDRDPSFSDVEFLLELLDK